MLTGMLRLRDQFASQKKSNKFKVRPFDDAFKSFSVSYLETGFRRDTDFLGDADPPKHIHEAKKSFQQTNH